MSLLIIVAHLTITLYSQCWLHCWQIGDNQYQCVGGHS